MVDKAENTFIKTLPQLSTRAPTLIINLRSISDIAAQRPIQHWIQLWTTEALAPDRDCVRDLLVGQSVSKIPWPLHINTWLLKLGLNDYWLHPTALSRDARES